MKKLDDALSETRQFATGVKQIPLTPKQKSAWDMTRASLLWNCPAFTHILYTMMSTQDGEVAVFTDQIPMAATDGVNMLLNPEWFFKQPLQSRVFVCAHEILHAIWDHCGQNFMNNKRGSVITPAGKKLEWDKDAMNRAQDFIINDLLIESKIGTFINGCLHDLAMGKHDDSAIDVYERVLKDKQNNGGGGGTGTGFDQHMDPGAGQGQDPTATTQARSSIEWDTAVAAGAASAKAQGKLPAALERFLGEILEPQVSWQEKIQSFFARKVGSGSYDWRRPDRNLIVRDIYAPGRSGFGAGHVVVAIDTSGSIGQPELDVFFAEMRGILGDVRPKKMSIIWIDAIVHKVDEIYEAEDVGGLKPAGGGGTDFRPAFDWIEENTPDDIDALVYLTDGYGQFPSHAPNYPVLWGAIVPGVAYPFGDVVDVPIKQ
jgi:predicted metal-dependent peptidase